MTTAFEATTTSTSPTADRQGPWLHLLGWAAAVSSAADVALMVLVGAAIPPVVVGVVLSVVGIALLASRTRVGVALLGVTGTLLVLSSAPFAAPHLGHPGSAVDFVHAVVHLGGRIVVVASAVGAWRSASPVVARRLQRVALGALAASVVVAGVALASPSDDRGDAAVTVAVRDFEFPSTIEAGRGDDLFVDNRDWVRHTFSVRDTDLSEDLRPRSGTRVDIDLAPGTYRLFCDVPGHESMQADLVVR